jgi:hypothetical protein
MRGVTAQRAGRLIIFVAALADLLVISHYFAANAYGCPAGMYPPAYCDTVFNRMWIAIIVVAFLAVTGWLATSRMQKS